MIMTLPSSVGGGSIFKRWMQWLVVSTITMTYGFNISFTNAQTCRMSRQVFQLTPISLGLYLVYGTKYCKPTIIHSTLRLKWEWAFILTINPSLQHNV